MTRQSTLSTRAALLHDAVQVMEAEHAKNLSVGTVARRIATSRRQLQRCFAEHDDASFRSCLARIRMEEAAKLLAETPLPVREVAYRVGYRQPAQFAKAFRRRHGVSPSVYRGRVRSLAFA